MEPRHLVRPDPQEAEAKIGCGQIEEVIIQVRVGTLARVIMAIVQAQNELDLSRGMLEWRAWEPLCEAAPEGQWKWPI